MNCATLPEGLLESELFGHEKGAFTGAGKPKPGRFELADGGTLFLDEVAELAPAAQAKLLRVLQEGEIERLGSTGRPTSVNVRVVAVTNQDLLKLAGEGRFREDLYYRLNVYAIDVPPLRERPEDIGPLAEHFLGVYARRLHKDITSFSGEAAALLRAYRWPGNVRELGHAVHRAVIRADGLEVRPADLGLRVDAAHTVGAGGEATTLADIERRSILATLERCGGNQRDAAGVLGIDRSTLHRRLKQYGVMGSDS